MEKGYLFEHEKENNPQNYYWFDKGFTSDELDTIKNGVNNLEFNQATVVSGNDLKDRSSSVKWVPQNEEFDWIYQRLMTMAQEANENTWKFNLLSAPELIQYTEYYDHANGHYTWHQDIGPGILSKRKVSITVQLSESTEYEGGDLEIWGGGEHLMKPERGRGNVILFPSYMMHRVTPITKGTRTSFVLWVGGDHYR
jgi:PKHD-type hydroxylase